ncbi:Lipocalin-like domain-containing protein [Cladophialophora immunda]|nr:Lipocalin-like domain-containing protein [Cladophialophora immunda]
MSDLWHEYRDHLTGGWKCISYEIYDGPSPSAKLVARPHGNNPMGRSYLSRNGYLAAHLATPDRMKYSESDVPWAKRSDAEIANVARGLSMYCGYMELFKDDKGLFWKTKVEIASDPTRVGGFQTRRVEFLEENGEAFKVLRPVDPIVLEDGTQAWAVVKWQRVESA